jgi:hypothetical protein
MQKCKNKNWVCIRHFYIPALLHSCISAILFTFCIESDVLFGILRDAWAASYGPLQPLRAANMMRHQPNLGARGKTGGRCV